MSNRRINNPCKECSDRSPICHGACKRYEEFKKALCEDKELKRRYFYSTGTGILMHKANIKNRDSQRMSNPWYRNKKENRGACDFV